MAAARFSSAATRNLVRSLPRQSPATAPFASRCASSTLSQSALRQNAWVSRQTKPLALSTIRQPTSLVRHASSGTPGTYQRPDKESKFAAEQLQADPAAVSTTSSVHPMLSEVGERAKEDETDMMAGIRHDVKVIKDTFKLDSVPTEAYRIGLAGVLPYLATSSATVFAAFEYNNAAHMGGTGYFISEQSAELLLQVLEPLQVGYGAVILSFLGAIHWGLEWAQFGGRQGYRRYAIGVLAPAVAWPTILMPVEYALISQFLAFNILYAVDSSTTRLGWTPAWYGTYRFILTFIVGASIVFSLIGRGQVSDRVGTLPSAAERIKDAAETRSKSKNKKKDDEDDEE